MDRALLVAALVVLVLLAAAGLLLGWRHRAARQADVPELPSVPADPGPELTEPLNGLYVSTTRSGAWQDRIVVQGLGRRARAELRVRAAGIVIDRIGESEIFIPAGSLTLVDTAVGIAGKVMGLPDGILLISWRLGNRLLDSGIRADDPHEQQRWLAVARTLITHAGEYDEPDGSPPSAGSALDEPAALTTGSHRTGLDDNGAHR